MNAKSRKQAEKIFLRLTSFSRVNKNTNYERHFQTCRFGYLVTVVEPFEKHLFKYKVPDGELFELLSWTRFGRKLDDYISVYHLNSKYELNWTLLFTYTKGEGISCHCHSPRSETRWRKGHSRFQWFRIKSTISSLLQGWSSIRKWCIFNSTRRYLQICK